MTLRKYVMGALMLSLLAFLLAGCRGADTASSEGIEFDLAIEPATPAIGDATLLVTVFASDGEPIDDATLDVRGDMTHGGMIPVIREGIRSSDGIYRIPFEWTMGGDWTITVDATLPDGRTASQTFDYVIDTDGDDMSGMNMDNMDMDTDDSDGDINNMDMSGMNMSGADDNASSADNGEG